MYNSSKQQCIEVIMRLQKLSCPNVQCVPESCIKVNSTHKKSCTLLWKEQYITCLYIVYIWGIPDYFSASLNPANIQSSSQNRSRSNLPTMKSKTFSCCIGITFTLFTWLCFPKNTRNYILYSFYKIKTKYLLLFGQNPSGWIDYVSHFLKTWSWKF